MSKLNVVTLEKIIFLTARVWQ